MKGLYIATISIAIIIIATVLITQGETHSVNGQFETQPVTVQQATGDGVINYSK